MFVLSTDMHISPQSLRRGTTRQSGNVAVKEGRKEILKRRQAIVNRHTKRGFQLNDHCSDNAFMKIESDIVTSLLHTQAAGAH